MTPDAIVIFSAGVVPLHEGGWRTTTYEEGDAFGTMGGRDRVETAALLAKKYPGAYLVTTSHVYTDELHELGVERGRIIQGRESSTTQIALDAALQLAQEKGWKRILFVSSGYHLPRIEAFYEQAKNNIEATFVSSESVLIQHDPAFAERFEKVKNTPAYQMRLVSEARGIEAIKNRNYRPAPIKDKKERPV